MRVAFLGLGIMGRSMAANLVKAGHEVSVWNRSSGKEVEGARSAVSPAEAAEGTEVIWMCVSDTKAVEEVLGGPTGVEKVLDEGMIIADSSTISPSATLRFAQRVKARGVHWVDAPMTGSKIAAESGNLIFMVGADDASLARLQPLFQATGKQVFHMGETGKGQATKLVMNLQIALIFEGFAEALTLGAKLGVDVEKIGRDFDVEGIARRFFSAHEQEQLAELPAAERDEAFFRCWTRKEAYIKATGDGLSLPLSQFDVSLQPGSSDALVATRPDGAEAGNWLLREVPAGAGYVAALCVRGRNWKLAGWNEE